MLHVYNNQFKFYFGSSFGRAVGLAYMVLSAFVSVCLGLPVCRKNYIPENLWNYTALQALRNRMWFLVTSEIKSRFCIQSGIRTMTWNILFPVCKPFNFFNLFISIGIMLGHSILSIMYTFILQQCNNYSQTRFSCFLVYCLKVST